MTIEHDTVLTLQTNDDDVSHHTGDAMRYRNKSLIFSMHQCINGRNPPSKLVRNPDSERSLLVLLWAPPCSARPRCFFRFVGHYLPADLLWRSPFPHLANLCIQYRITRHYRLLTLHIMHRGSSGPTTFPFNHRLPALRHEQKSRQFVQQLNPTGPRHWHDASLRK